MEIPRERAEEIRLVLKALPAGFDPNSSPYIPYGKYQSTRGMNLETNDPGLPIGDGASARVYLKTGVLNGQKITYICKTWSRWEPVTYFYEEVLVYTHPQLLRPLQGICVPHLIQVCDSFAGRMSMALEMPHPEGWREADASISQKLKDDIIATYELVHAQGLIHGDAELRHMLIGHDDKITLIDFGRAKTLGKLPKLPQCTELDMHVEMRRVKFLLDYNGAKARERKLYHEHGGSNIDRRKRDAMGYDAPLSPVTMREIDYIDPEEYPEEYKNGRMGHSFTVPDDKRNPPYVSDGKPFKLLPLGPYSKQDNDKLGTLMSGLAKLEEGWRTTDIWAKRDAMEDFLEGVIPLKDGIFRPYEEPQTGVVRRNRRRSTRPSDPLHTPAAAISHGPLESRIPDSLKPAAAAASTAQSPTRAANVLDGPSSTAPPSSAVAESSSTAAVDGSNYRLPGQQHPTLSTVLLASPSLHAGSSHTDGSNHNCASQSLSNGHAPRKPSTARPSPLIQSVVARDSDQPSARIVPTTPTNGAHPPQPSTVPPPPRQVLLNQPATHPVVPDDRVPAPAPSSESMLQIPATLPTVSASLVQSTIQAVTQGFFSALLSAPLAGNAPTPETRTLQSMLAELYHPTNAAAQPPRPSAHEPSQAAASGIAPATMSRLDDPVAGLLPIPMHLAQSVAERSSVFAGETFRSRPLPLADDVPQDVGEKLALINVVTSAGISRRWILPVNLAVGIARQLNGSDRPVTTTDTRAQTSGLKRKPEEEIESSPAKRVHVDQ